MFGKNKHRNVEAVGGITVHSFLIEMPSNANCHLQFFYLFPQKLKPHIDWAILFYSFFLLYSTRLVLFQYGNLYKETCFE